MPLTAGGRRFLLRCPALASMRVASATPVVTRVFKEYGLPQRLHTDHGVPCATNTLGRRSQLLA